MDKISFHLEKQVARFINPLKNNKLDSQEIEVRYDPLLGHQSVLNRDLKDKASILFPDTDKDYLLEVVKESEAHCFLCSGRWKDTTPRYPDELIPGGRLIKGEVVLFPNLFPLFEYHPVVMLGEKHYRDLNDFSASLLADALTVCLEFIERCFRNDPSAKYFTINANYLFPAGSSVVHPHLQIIGGPVPVTHQKDLIERSSSYHESNGSVYWNDLIEKEKKIGRRWIGELKGGCLITSFSPIGQNEVQIIWPSKRHFLEWDDGDVKFAAVGISNVLNVYHSMNFSTFNFSIFSGSLDGSDDSFRCMMRIITRQNVVPNHRTDDYYFQKLLRDEIILVPPEKLAEKIRVALAKSLK